ncbi:hypothetical protein MKQ68_02160 [Chitinophaga horti]|uniref:Uncharacterized protein n=1 Tax=Chitinophaga horti TaxID=2920382 RepID=A0ABY6J6H7_9BACT|nr:DUF6702 family protein [Chitinophaga horti]UYQ93899.1 hypothetical protein MKQ68_02160 [Chitinophaga horti]
MGLLFCKWLLPLYLHPFYVSVTEIKHNPGKQRLEVSCRIFADDFENTLKKNYNTTFDIIKPTNRRLVDSLAGDYIKKHLVLQADGKPVNLRYLGYEIQEDAAWCYLEAPAGATLNKLRLKDDLLFESHESQINMVHVIVKNERKSTKLDNPKADAEFNF